MKIFPSEKFEIDTGRTREEVVECLKSVTDKDRFTNWLLSVKPYMGEVDEKGFRIIETFVGKRGLFINIGFSSEIYGSFKNTDKGTIISVDLRLSRITKTVAIFYWAFLSAIFITLLWGSLAYKKSLMILFAPVILFVLGIVFIRLGFRHDIREVKPGLFRIFGQKKT